MREEGDSPSVANDSASLPSTLRPSRQSQAGVSLEMPSQIPVPPPSQHSSMAPPPSQPRPPLSEQQKKEAFELPREDRAPPSPDPLPPMLSQQQLQQQLFQQQLQQQQQQQLLQQQLYQQTGLNAVPSATLPLDLSLESSVNPSLGVSLGGPLNCTNAGAQQLSSTALPATAPLAAAPLAFSSPDGFYFALPPLDAQCCLPLLPGGPVYSVAPALYPTWTASPAPASWTATNFAANGAAPSDPQLNPALYASPGMWNAATASPPQKPLKTKRQQRCCC